MGIWLYVKVISVLFYILLPPEFAISAEIYVPLKAGHKPRYGFITRLSDLSDGTKLAVRDKAGNGYTYLGSLIYQSNGGNLTLEGTQRVQN